MQKFLFILLLIGSSTYFAQSVGGSLILGIPQNEFKENVNNSLFGGIEGQVTLATPGKLNPFTVGLNASFMIYGIESRRAPLSTTVPDVTVDVERTNSMVNFHLLFQICPFDGQVRPYLEGVAGGAYIWTETTVEGSNDLYEFASTVNQDDFAWSYGAGGGILVSLLEASEDIPGGLFLDLKARFMFGSEAEYLTTGDLRVIDGRLIYDTQRSGIDYLAIQIGVVAGI
jgi:hypothetical protein